MNREEAKQLTETALNELTRQLEQGHSEQLQAYLDFMARFHQYSFGNIILIAWQRPGATHVAGFHTWRKLGRWVRKGESGIAILAPMVCKSRRELQNDHDKADAGDLARDERPGRLAGFRVVHVFDITQTEGEEIPQFAVVQGDADDMLLRLKALIAGHGIGIESRQLPMGTHGASAGGRIYLRENMSAAQSFAILIHEFAHELLHRKVRASKTTIETEAEAVAYVVCRAVGLDPNTACADYIQLYQGKADALLASLEVIQQTAAGIIVGLMQE